LKASKFPSFGQDLRRALFPSAEQGRALGLYGASFGGLAHILTPDYDGDWLSRPGAASSRSCLR
jgi:hypothetical protein